MPLSKVSSSRHRVGPHPVTNVLIRSRKRGLRHTDQGEGHEMLEAEKRRRGHKRRKTGLPVPTRTYKEAREDPPQGSALPTPSSQTLASRAGVAEGMASFSVR